MTATELATTALVVARPTPCVPPDRPHPDMAADADDREAEEERLDEAHPDVLDVEALHHRVPVNRRRDAKQRRRHDPAADHADGARNHRQQRHHHEAREHARNDQLTDRIGPERAQRRNLIGHHHRAELGGDPRSDAPGDHQPCEHRTKLLHDRGAYEAADHRPRAELIEREA